MKSMVLLFSAILAACTLTACQTTQSQKMSNNSESQARTPAQENAQGPFYGNINVKDFSFRRLPNNQYGNSEIEFTLKIEPVMGCTDFNGQPTVIQTLNFNEIILSPAARLQGVNCVARDYSTEVKTVIVVPRNFSGGTQNFSVKMPFRDISVGAGQGNVSLFHSVQFTTQSDNRLEGSARVYRVSAQNQRSF